MKHTFFSALLTLGVLVGCSHVQDSKRIPASVKDVGVIGPGGEVILYYKEGDSIIVKACDPHTILGMRPAQARSNCQGKFNKVPLDSFKDALRNLVSTDRLNVLKPLTAEEVEAYSKNGPSSDQVEAMVDELDKINKLINYACRNFKKTRKCDEANLAKRDELIKSLRSPETRISAIEKINAEIEKAVNLIANQTKLTLTKLNSDKDKFLYTVLKQFNPNEKFPCGLNWSIDERIKDCSYQLTSEKDGFVLVTRTMDFKEVHMELKTGHLWSDRLPNSMTHDNAEKACKPSLKEVAGISGVTWRLPSIDEYREADKNGIRKALPNMHYWFWSSSVRRNDSDLAWLFNGNDGDTDDDYRTYVDYRDSSDNSVRCVAR